MKVQRQVNGIINLALACVSNEATRAQIRAR
jgi:hypothetical protein